MSTTAESVTPLRRVTRLLPTRADLEQMRTNPRRDLLAGLMVALVALPLALGFGISSGAGAAAGIATAIIAGLVAAVFGGSNLQVSGPTGAMTVVLVPIVATYGVPSVLVVGVLAGVLLVILALAGAGRVMRYVPVPVIEGFTIGIALIIGLQQIPGALGVHVKADGVIATAVRSVQEWFTHPHWAPVLIAVFVAAAILLLARVRPGIPVALPAIIVVTVANLLMHLGAEQIGKIPAGLPAPSLPDLAPSTIRQLVIPAIAVAALAALESLMSASAADAMTVGQRHDSDRELFGQGLANIAAPLFGGVPATGAIARTAVNVKTGAHSRLAAITHSLLLLIVVLIAGGLVGKIPLAALAGVLIATAVSMVSVSSVRTLMRATKQDAAVLAITAIATVALDLVEAVIIGMIVAGGLALKQVAASAAVSTEDVATLADSRADDLQREHLLDEHIVVYRLEGPLFFAAAHDFLLELTRVSDVRVVILRMAHLTAIDATGAATLSDVITRLERRGITVMLSGVRPEHAAILQGLGVYDTISHERHIFERTPDAIAHARLHVSRVPHDPGPAVENVSV